MKHPLQCEISNVYEYYDKPLLFSFSHNGEHWIANLVEEGDGEEVWLIASCETLPKDDLSDADIINLFKHPYNDIAYTLTAVNGREILQAIDSSDIGDSWLPCHMTGAILLNECGTQNREGQVICPSCFPKQDETPSKNKS